MQEQKGEGNVCCMFGDSRQKASTAPFPYTPGLGRKHRIPPGFGKLDLQARSMNFQLSYGLGSGAAETGNGLPQAPGLRLLSRQQSPAAQVSPWAFPLRYPRHTFLL